MKKTLLIFTFCFLGLIALVHGQTFNQDTVYHHDSGDKIYHASQVDSIPKFPGGRLGFFKWYSQNFKYPSKAKENGIQGVVRGSFIVEADGSITDPIIVQGVDESLDSEVIRLFRLLPDFIPGKKDGRNVRVQFNLPVKFSLND